jgi:hypothetical protein
MSHKSILRAALLLIVIAAIACSAAEVTASWASGSQGAASWVSGTAPDPDTPPDFGN